MIEKIDERYIKVETDRFPEDAIKIGVSPNGTQWSAIILDNKRQVSLLIEMLNKYLAENGDENVK